MRARRTPWLARIFAVGASVGLAPATGALAPAAVAARARTVLVELYTSQGCSSCPPAELLVAALPSLGLGPDRVVPLSFHVDYWDRLGWPDPFADPAFTERQDWYARLGHLRPPTGGGREMTGLYTPQMIIDGQVHLPGGQRATALDAIRRAGTVAPLVDVAGAARAIGDDVVAKVELGTRASLDRARDWRLTVALAAAREQTHVLRGENSGETLEQAAVVRAMSAPIALSPIGAVARELTVRLKKPADLAWSNIELIAFVQDAATGEVAGAAALSRQ